MVFRCSYLGWYWCKYVCREWYTYRYRYMSIDWYRSGGGDTVQRKPSKTQAKQKGLDSRAIPKQYGNIMVIYIYIYINISLAEEL